jgi:hypothetical protein
VPDSRSNAGLWEKIWFDEEQQILMGELNSENPNDAAKIGTTVKEVSPLLKTFIDGSGRKWEDAPYHIALVTHPIQAGQANFQPLEIAASLCGEEGFAFSMSDIEELLLPEKEQPLTEIPVEDKTLGNHEGVAMAENGEGGSVKDEVVKKVVKTNLKELLGLLKKAGIALPDDTSAENFVERLTVAINAITFEDDKDSENKPPHEQPMPVAMSLGDTTVADTPNPFQAIAENQARLGYVGRIEALVKTGRVAPAYALQHLKPKVEGFALSLGEDGSPQPSTLDEILGALEAIPENTILNVSGRGVTDKDKKGIAFSFEEPLPEGYEGNDQINEEKAGELADSQLKQAGYKTK